MDKSLIFNKLQKKATELEIIENLYENDSFANYYQSIINQDELLGDDIDSYKQFFDQSMPVLEIGSGTGRIFNPLFEEGYNIFGLEPAKEMSEYITPKGRDRIYSHTLQEIEKLPQKNIEVIIIPATTVSLFSHEDFYDFLKKIKETQPHIRRIVFDFLKESFFESTDGLIQSNYVNGEKFYNVNFFDPTKEQIIYNLVSPKKLGISVKYSYSHEVLEKIFRKLGFSLKLVKDSDTYAMVEGIFNEE
ncbi:methyltransferase domain-containing protein [Streptococcus dentapri]|uniref:Methyltransferase domain-containing protein n=1 Tax=Streptococcus dentapri TaxID=573564 RepID=A0ABV8D2J0_9STRE